MDMGLLKMNEELYTTENYNNLVSLKDYLQSTINEFYVNYDNFVFDDKLIIAEIIDEYKTIIFELEKFIIIYNQIQTDIKIKNQYTVIYGDTLPRVALKSTGNVNNWKAIYKFNNLKDIFLTPGDTLDIPEESYYE